MQRNNSPFETGKRLSTSELYVAAVGLFEQHSNFRHVTTVTTDDSDIQITERARVYQNTITQEYHILYYPAKDNDRNVTQDEQKDIPLKKLFDDVKNELFHEAWYSTAKKHFFICESNTYLDFQVSHYIYANLNHHVSKTGLLTTVLTTDDSISRPWGQYDLSYVRDTVKNVVNDIVNDIVNNVDPNMNPDIAKDISKGIAEGIDPDIKHNPVHRGWQSNTNKSKCGHYALIALNREISQLPYKNQNEKVEINNSDILVHNRFYDVGSRARIQMKPLDTTVSNREGVRISLQDGDESFCEMGGGDEPDKKPVTPAKKAGTQQKTPPKPSFWERHKAKFIGGGIGTLLGIGLAVGLLICLAPLTGGASLVAGSLIIAGFCVSSIWAGVTAGVITETCCQTPSTTTTTHMYKKFGSVPGVPEKDEKKSQSNERNNESKNKHKGPKNKEPLEPTIPPLDPASSIKKPRQYKRR